MSKIKNNIKINGLGKIDIRVGTILSVEDIERSDKMVKLIVDFGEVSEGMLFDIGYQDGITPVLALPEIVVPNGSRAG